MKVKQLSKENQMHRAIQAWCRSRKNQGWLIFDSCIKGTARKGVNY